MEKVFVLGGTGFLGYYTSLELIKRGYQVKTMALPPLPAEGLFKEGTPVEMTLGNINELSDGEILEQLEGCTGFIYAAGADERTVPKAPASTFFYEANVLPTQRLARLAKLAGVKNFVLFGSYFAEFAERYPEFNLAKEQAYPNTRLLQEQIAFSEGDGGMTVTSLRLPYIFGTMPGRVPLWKMFVDQIKGQEVYPALSGGTAMVTVDQVAEATVGAMEKGTHRETYAISGGNMKYQAFYEMIVEELGQKTEVPVVPYESMAEVYLKLDQESADNGVEHGIHIAVSAKTQTIDFYIEPSETQELLGFKTYDVFEEARRTIKHCL